MKLVLGYVIPKKKFNDDTEVLMKIQVDNALELGWKLEDIIFVANFDWEYRGVKSLPISDDAYCEFCPVNSKMGIVCDMFKRGMIGDELYWIHDLDAYQMEVITEEDVDMGHHDFALCDYGRVPKWNGGSIFFKKGARKIFEMNNEAMNRLKMVDEDSLREVIQSSETIYNKIKKLNITFNFQPWNIRNVYKMAIKPIKVAHFDLFGGVRQLGIKSALDWYKGNNKINTPLLNQRILEIFKKYNL